MMASLERGLVQVYTGDGKGKTTAAFGQALRAWGRGFKICIIQFLKDGCSGEVAALKEAAPEIEIFSFGDGSFVPPEGPSRLQVDQASRAVGLARIKMSEDDLDLLILDEICSAAALNVLDRDEIITLIGIKPRCLELILTGRNAGREVIGAADLVTEMRALKHPFSEGIAPRKGIEY